LIPAGRAAWSGYGYKPAAWLARSASLLNTRSRDRSNTLSGCGVTKRTGGLTRRRPPRRRGQANAADPARCRRVGIKAEPRPNGPEVATRRRRTTAKAAEHSDARRDARLDAPDPTFGPGCPQLVGAAFASDNSYCGKLQSSSRGASIIETPSWNPNRETDGECRSASACAFVLPYATRAMLAGAGNRRELSPTYDVLSRANAKREPQARPRAASGAVAGSRYGRGLNNPPDLTVFNGLSSPVSMCGGPGALSPSLQTSRRPALHALPKRWRSWHD
jgi:hypothetical protein